MAAITTSHILGILSLKDCRWTEDSFAQLFCKSFSRWVAIVCCLVLIFQSSSSHISSVGYWFCRPRYQLKNVLFLFAFNVPLAEFTSMLWVIILHGYKSLNLKLHFRWDHVILQYAVTPSLIQFALHLVQIHNFAIGKSPLALQLVWYRGLQLFHQFFAAYRPSYLNQRFWSLIRQSKYFIRLLYCPVFVHLGSLEIFPPAVISWPQFCHIGQLHRVFSSDINTFFS